MDYINTILVEEIENYFCKKENSYSFSNYLLNKHMDFVIEQIHMYIYIYKKKESKTYYYYDLYTKNFGYESKIAKDLGYRYERINLFTSSHFNTVLALFENLKDVKMNYSFYNNYLYSPNQKKKLLKLKKSLSFFPKEEEETECSICYEPTKQLTICNHPICLQCRETCIIQEKENCPICRSTKLYIYPNNLFFTL